MLSSLLPVPSWFQIAAPFALIIALAVGVLLRARTGRLSRTLVTGLFALGAVMGVMNFAGWNIARKSYFNEYDFYHYYMPAKYAPEVGYFSMYVATLGASEELGHKRVSKVRDLRTDTHVSAKDALKKVKKAKAKFSEARWKEWVADVDFYRRNVSDEVWRKMLKDRGYNGTPIWTMLWGWLANQVPTSDTVGMHALAFIDVAFWIGAFAAVAWAFGPRTMFIVVAMLGLQFVTNWVPLKAAYVRIEWIAELLAAMAFMKKGKHATAGVLVGLSVTSRIFPIFWAFGAAVTVALTLWRERRLDRPATRFLVAIGLTGVTLTLASFAATSVRYWQDFLDKIGHLSTVFSSWRVGFEYLYTLSWDGNAPGGVPVDQFFAEHELLRLIPKGLAVIGAAALAPRLRERWEQLLLGFILTYFLMGLLYYYYVMLLVPTLWLASRSDKPSRAAMLAWMFGSSALVTWLCQDWDRGYKTYFVVSLSTFVLIVGMVIEIWREGSKGLADRPAQEAHQG